jgi:hypothetical protein
MATLGEQFKAAREAKGVSEADAGSATKILTKVIIAMEANDFSHMAAPTYAKGFIRLYAKYLGLDPEPMVEQYTKNHAVSPPRLVDHNSQLEINRRRQHGQPGLPKGTAAKPKKPLSDDGSQQPGLAKDAAAKLNPLPLLAPLGKLFAGRLKKVPLSRFKKVPLSRLKKVPLSRLKDMPIGPLKDIRVTAGLVAALLVLAALISTVATCVRRQAAETAENPSAAPARMLLEEPLPDLYLIEPGKIESN